MPKFDLSKPLTNLEGHPVADGGQYMMFQQPQQVRVLSSGEAFDDVQVMIVGSKDLTYLQAIRKALIADMPEQQRAAHEQIDVDACCLLAMRLGSCDPEKVELNSREDIPLILKAAKAAPNVPRLHYMRLMELLDPPGQQPKK